MSGVIAEVLMGKELAGPPHPHLDFIENQQQPVLVAELSDLLER